MSSAQATPSKTGFAKLNSTMYFRPRRRSGAWPRTTSACRSEPRGGTDRAILDRCGPKAMSASPFDHPMLSALLGDSVIAAEFAFEAELKCMLAFEAALAEAEAAEGIIPIASATAIVAAIQRFRPELGRLAEGTARDGVVVPELVAQLRSAVGDSHGRHVHFGATSQDLVDSSLFKRLERVSRELDRRLADLIGRLDRLEAAEGSRRVMGHT